MALTYQYYDAAHTYGMDNMGVNTAISTANANRIGQYVSESTSWVGDEPPVGQPVSGKIFMSGGFTILANFTMTSATSAVFTNLSLLRTSTNETLYSMTGDLQVTGANIDQIINGTGILNGSDTINGNRFNNALRGYAGNDRIDGGAGTDTAYFSGTAGQSQIARNGSSITVTGPDGSDTLLNIERLRFDDKVIAFDTDGNAGQAYRLYQAAFNRTPDSSGLAYQVNTLDAGWGLAAIAQNFINSPEFVKTYGSLNTTQFVTQLYANVLHRAPDEGGLAYHTGNLDRGELSRAQVLVGFSESPENQAALIGVIGNGMSYSNQFA
jgi:hypothetical protein